MQPCPPSRIASPPLATHYRVLCTAIALVAFGSGWYHVAPSNASLMWDRLPMTVAFMALFAAVLADRISWVLGRALLWPLVVAGIASIAWWVRTEAAGAGDLRAYALVQFLPLMLIPLILLLWRQGSLAARPLWLAIAAYVRTNDPQTVYARQMAQERCRQIGDNFVRAGLEPRRLESRAVVTPAPVLLDPQDDPARYNQAIEIIPLDR